VTGISGETPLECRVEASGCDDKAKTASGYEWKAVPIGDRLANLGVQTSLQTNNSYVIQLKTGGTSGTAASTFYIRMGTSGTWHQITTT
jgi:hypothetical protein